MSVVTVVGASGAIIPVSVNGAIAFSLAKAYAAAVNGFAADGRLFANNLTMGVAPPVDPTSGIPGGLRGEGVISTPGIYDFPKTYRFVTDDSSGPVTIDETHLHSNSSVLAGVGGTFVYGGTGGGSIIAGGGNNLFYGLAKFSGDYTLAFGDGNDTIYAGSGHDLIYDGTGTSDIYLGDNSSKVFSHGSDYIVGGSGKDTITLDGSNETVVAGTGALDIIINGTGDTVIGATSNDTISGIGIAKVAKAAVATHTVTDLSKSAGSMTHLFGYRAADVTKALASAKDTHLGAVVTLSDKSTITFTDVKAEHLSKLFHGS